MARLTTMDGPGREDYIALYQFAEYLKDNAKTIDIRIIDHQGIERWISANWLVHLGEYLKGLGFNPLITSGTVTPSFIPSEILEEE